MKTDFDNIKGYAYDTPTKLDLIEEKIKNTLSIIETDSIAKFQNILVAGCGKGDEAKIFFKIIDGNVFGIDLNAVSCEIIDEDKMLLLKEGNVEKIDFPNEKFDFIYCYHVLEHVSSPQLVLQEFNRVLKKGGKIFIGFPNRNRILPSYFSSHHRISVRKILLYNLNDYIKRITSRFKNEYGAHAGFTTNEFIGLACNLFHINIINKEWIKLTYPKYFKIFETLEFFHLAKYFYPSNYFKLLKK